MTDEELKEAIFMALGAASMCWDPLPSNQVFESTRAKEIGDKLVEKIMPLLSQCEAMQKVVEAAKEAYQKAPIQHQPAAWIVNLGKALSHLGEGV